MGERKDQLAFARSGQSGLFGKLADEPINGLKVPREVQDRLLEMSHEAGLPFQELIRELLTIAAFGRAEVERRFQARLDAIEGKVEQ